MRKRKPFNDLLAAFYFILVYYNIQKKYGIGYMLFHKKYVKQEVILFADQGKMDSDLW